MPYIWKDTDREQPLNRAFTKNDIQYPRNWIIHASEDDRKAIGLEWVNDDRPKNNERYYRITGRRGDWKVEPKDLDGLKKQAVENCKRHAANRLAGTDWYIVRKTESGAVVPTDIAEFRAATRAYSNELEEAIDAADFEGIQKIEQAWPESPGEKARREEQVND